MGYIIGRQVVVEARFYNRDDELQDPTEVVFKVRAPSGEETPYTYGQGQTVTRVDEGIYELPLALDESGEWVVRVEATGAVHQADETRITVYRSRVSSAS